jgi:uncharacterized protein YqgC (DUF456 family)
MHRIIIGIIITILAALLTIKADWVVNNFGHSAWAESKFGTEGGTRLMYKLIGIVGVLIGLLTITNLHARFLGWILAPFLPK